MYTMSLKPCGTQHNSRGHYPQEAMAEVKIHIDLKIEVGGVREDQGTYPVRSWKASPGRCH